MSQTIEVSIAEVLSKLDGKISGLDKRLENLEFIARTVGGGVVVALQRRFAKLLFPSFGL